MKTSPFIALAVLVSSTLPLKAVSRSWSGGAGSAEWTTAGNWDPSGIPAAGDDVFFTNNTNFQNGTTVRIASNNISINSLTVDVAALRMTHAGNPIINLGNSSTVGQLTLTSAFTTDSTILSVEGTASRVARMQFDSGVLLTNNGTGVAEFGRAFLQNSATNTTGGSVTFSGAGSWRFAALSYIGKNLSGVGGTVTTSNAVIDVNLGDNDHAFSGVVQYGATEAMNVSNVRVNAGSLILANSGIITTGNSTTSGLQVAANGTFGGTGSVTGSATINGVLTPGTSTDSTGTLTFNTGLTLQSSAQIQMDITGLGAGAFDSIVVAGTLSYDGNLTLTLSGSYIEGDAWSLFSGFSQIEGGLDAVTLNGVGFAQSGNLWLGSFGGSTYQFNQLDGSLTVVPEPHTMAFLAISALAFVVVRARRRQTA